MSRRQTVLEGYCVHNIYYHTQGVLFKKPSLFKVPSINHPALLFSAIRLTLQAPSHKVPEAFKAKSNPTAIEPRMPVKIEVQTSVKLPRQTQTHLEAILDSLPREHLRGIERLRLVDRITDPSLRINAPSAELPGLYHPRQGKQQAWLEVAIGALLPRSQPFFKKLVPRLSFKGNLAAVVFSLVGQHYYLTLRHSIKRGQLETAVRTYTEKQLRRWQEQQHSLRARLFRPLQPTLERWGRALQKRAAHEKKRNQTARS